MGEFKYTVETIDGDKYFTTVNSRGNQTMVFRMCGDVFVQTNSTPPKAVADSKRLSKDAKALIEILEADELEQKKKVSAKKTRSENLSDKYTQDELHEMIVEIESDPESKVGAKGLYIFNDSARKKIDELSWAIYYRNGFAQKTANNALPDSDRRYW